MMQHLAEMQRQIKQLPREVERLKRVEKLAKFGGGLDLTFWPSIALASGASQAFSDTNFRGIVMVSETVTYGGFAVFVMDGSNTVEVADTLGMYSPTAGNAGTVNLYITASVPTVQNNRALTVTLMIQTLRSS